MRDPDDILPRDYYLMSPGPIKKEDDTRRNAYDDAVADGASHDEAEAIADEVVAYEEGQPATCDHCGGPYHGQGGDWACLNA